MKTFFQLFAHKLRLSNPWRYKAPLLMAVPYFMLVFSEIDTWMAIKFILLSYITIIGIAGLGYLINDYSDREKDGLAGKTNALIDMSMGRIRLLFLLFGVLAVAPWFIFPMTVWSLFLLVLELGLFAAYSLPPIRLKERGIAGVLTDSLYAHVVPTILAAYTFWLIDDRNYHAFGTFVVVFGLWQLILGIRNIVLHQLKDANADRNSGTRTWMLDWGAEKSRRWTRWLLVLEVLAFLANCFFFLKNMPLFLIVLLAFWSLRWWEDYVRNISTGKDRLRFSAHYYLDDFYIRIFPLVVIFYLIPDRIDVLPILILHVALFPNIVKTSLIKLFWKLFNSLPSGLRLLISGGRLWPSIVFHLIVAVAYLGLITYGYRLLSMSFNTPSANHFFYWLGIQLGVAIMLIHVLYFSLARRTLSDFSEGQKFGI
jgi:4-hydroxybenzoate polyprenyltransferase